VLELDEAARVNDGCKPRLQAQAVTSMVNGVGQRRNTASILLELSACNSAPERNSVDSIANRFASELPVQRPRGPRSVELKSWEMGCQGWVISDGNLRNLRAAFCKHSLNGSSLIAKFFLKANKDIALGVKR